MRRKFLTKGDDYMRENSSSKDSGNNVDNDIFGEVNKFLEEKEEYIKESIIGYRTIEELGEFNLDVGIKKTYLCADSKNKKVYSILTRIIENFIQSYGGTATVYPKGEQICIELVTPKISI